MANTARGLQHPAHEYREIPLGRYRVIEESTMAFEMRNARDAVALGFAPIEQYVVALERAVNESSDLTFDLAKSILESTCKAVLVAHSIEAGPKDDLPKLFRSVVQTVSLVPSDATHEVGVSESLTGC